MNLPEDCLLDISNESYEQTSHHPTYLTYLPADPPTHTHIPGRARAIEGKMSRGNLQGIAVWLVQSGGSSLYRSLADEGAPP